MVHFKAVIRIELCLYLVILCCCIISPVHTDENTWEYFKSASVSAIICKCCNLGHVIKFPSMA